MSEKYKIYHNPRCSKSRMALEFLKKEGKDVEIIEYLKEIPSKEELLVVLKKLNLSAESIIRKGESIFKENYKGKNMSEDQWVEAMLKFPKLIERPIVIKANRAVVARPTELINNLD
ncbi:MAG: arsenate reductase (glutaredoxin) [Crocinitomicaceae bacterium]|nr:arsenate reductase (glutaredoxin) [Crocinitomicaceae bacterium]